MGSKKVNSYGVTMEQLKSQIEQWLDLGYINPEDIPSIELYMDQVTTFMDRYLSKNKRTEEDKTLTITIRDILRNISYCLYIYTTLRMWSLSMTFR